MARIIRRTVFPYMRPDANRVHGQPWRTPDGRELGQDLPDWDYQAEIRLLRELLIDTPAILHECSLGKDAVLRISVVARSKGSGEKVCCFRQELKSLGHPDEVTVDIRIQNPSLCGALGILTCLTVVSAGEKASPLSPQELGNLLWEDHAEVLLEGIGARFPIEIADFQEMGWLAASAGWYLDWSPDFLDQPFLGTVRLLINSRHAAVLKAVTSSNPDDADRAVLSGIYFETGRSLILGALAHEEYRNGSLACGEGTLGQVVDSILRLHFPSESRTALYQRATHDCEDFNAALQDRLQLFDLEPRSD